MKSLHVNTPSRWWMASLALVLALVAGNCTGKKLELRVSSTHQETFAALKKTNYSGKAIDKVLSALEKDGNAFCKALIGGKKPPAGLLAKTLPSKKKKELIAKWDKDNYSGVLLGCKNWYKLTDVKPARDFGLVKERYDKEGKLQYDCYSVGLMQPYIMASQLKCSRLSIVDINYRTIKLHYEVLSEIRKAKEGETINAEEKFKGKTLHFPADFSEAGKKIKKSVKLSVKKVCGDDNYQQCASALATAATNLAAIQEIRLFLAPLHEVVTKESPLADAQPVVYLSNAIDPEFMDKKHMQELVDNFAAIAPENGSIFMYHQAGKKELGLYQVGKDASVRVGCSDKFVATKTVVKYNFCGIATTSTSKEKYVTHLDKMAGLKDDDKKKGVVCTPKKKKKK